jgi:hypothetical protein
MSEGLIPTPTVGDSKNARNSTAVRHKLPPTGIHAGNTLTDWITLQQAAPSVSPQLTLFAEAFPVSRTPWLVDAADLPTTATSGPSTPVSFASYGRDGSWLKTSQGYSQVTLDGSLAPFSETWPRAGMTRNGIAYLRPPSAPLTDGTEYGSWPTPTARDHKDGTAQSCANVPANGLLGRVVHQQWPTPQARDSHNRAGQAHRYLVEKRWNLQDCLASRAEGGSLNPTWVEWLMGYPLGWTVCEAWATRSSRRSRNGSRVASSKQKGRSHD